MLRPLSALSALLLFVATSARADERIRRFLSDVQIQKDSSLEVTETIDVEVENVAITHGIFRDFPTRYRRPDGGAMRVGFTFEGATLDGMPIPASVSGFANGVRIKIGDPDRTIPPGDHSFVVHYRTTRQIGRFGGYDELWWNATGNGWQFPIDLAQARIRLPEPAAFGDRTFYTGPYGSTAANAEIVDERPGDILVQTTQPLAAFEGLSVAVAFPKGVVGAPGANSRLGWWLTDNGPPILGFLVLLGLCAFYYVAWLRAGRDPRAGTVVPIFSPPDTLTPAGMRYVTKMNADDRAFAAALVDMGVRGHIRMVEEDEGWFSSKKTRIERIENESTLPDEEKAALDELCLPGESILMEQKNHTSFSTAKNSLSEILKVRYEGKLFKRNYGWAAAGLLLFLAGLWLTAASVVVATGAIDPWKAGVIFGSLLVVALLWLAFHDSAAGKCLLSLISLVGVALATTFGFPIVVEALNTGWWLPLLLPALAAPLVLSAFWWISAPTPEGRTVLDHISGFRQYLSIAERERLDRMTGAPDDTVQLFEKYLPYAIALGVENRWANRFAAVLAAAAAQGHQGFVWYSGSSSPWDNPTGFTHDVGSSLASTISSASAAPGSSSGSGGGGFSGGGGGGGGGGGW